MVNNKKKSIRITVISFVLIIAVSMMGFLTACAPNQSDNVEGIVSDGIDVPLTVLDQAKNVVAQLYKMDKDEYPDYNYRNWRIEALEHVYTYDDFDGMTLLVYQMNYEFLSETPDKIILAGGMYITDDNWVMPNYPNSRFLIFQENNDEFVFLHHMMENDCFPGDELFTDDLRQILDK